MARLLGIFSEAGRKKLELEEEIKASRNLKYGPRAIEGYATEYPNRPDTFEELARVWTDRVLLLTHGIDDVLEILETINHAGLRQRLIQAYAGRTEDPGNLVRLASKIWVRRHQDFSACLDGSSFEDSELCTELTISMRAEKLLSAERPRFGPVHLKWLATQIHDPIKDGTDGTGSRVAEEILIAMALPELTDAQAAAELASSFGTLTGCHELLRCYVLKKGIADFSEGRVLAKAIAHLRYGGKETAWLIYSLLKQKLEKDGAVENGEVTISDIPDLTSFLNSCLESAANFHLRCRPNGNENCRSCELLDECKPPEAIPLTPNRDHLLWHIERIDFKGPIEDCCGWLKEELKRISRKKGKIKRVAINGLTAEGFLENFGHRIDPELRQIITSALAEA